MAKEYFEEWMSAAMSRFKLANVAIKEGLLKDAAFDLHQTIERLYHCALLVCTFYTPHSHNIAFLRTHAERLDRHLLIWPMDSRKDRATFEKLKDAYVKARYSRHYKITIEELTWLAERIKELGQAVHAVCAERIAALEAAAQGAAA